MVGGRREAEAYRWPTFKSGPSERSRISGRERHTVFMLDSFYSVLTQDIV